MKILLKNLLIRSFFIKHMRRDKIEWNKDEYKKWLKWIKIFLEILIMIIYIIYDQSIRMKKLTIILTKNQIYEIREVYWSRRYIMIIIEYSKTYSITEKNKLIIRFLSKKMRDLLIKYLSLIHLMKIFILK